MFLFHQKTIKYYIFNKMPIKFIVSYKFNKAPMNVLYGAWKLGGKEEKTSVPLCHGIS